MQQDILQDIPSSKIYKERTIYFAAFFTGPLSAGYLMAENFRSFGKPAAARLTIAGTIVFTLLMVIISISPQAQNVPNIVFPLFYGAITLFLIRKWQRKDIVQHLAQAGKCYPGWRALVISIAGFLIILSALLGALYLTDPAAFNS